MPPHLLFRNFGSKAALFREALVVRPREPPHGNQLLDRGPARHSAIEAPDASPRRLIPT
jgi:hypothetical protein